MGTWIFASKGLGPQKQLVPYGTRYLRGPFPFSAHISPYQPEADEIYSIESNTYRWLNLYEDRPSKCRKLSMPAYRDIFETFRTSFIN